MLRDIKASSQNKSFPLPKPLVSAHLKLERRQKERKQRKQHAIDQMFQGGGVIELVQPPDERAAGYYRGSSVYVTSDDHYFCALLPLPSYLEPYRLH